MTRTAVFSMLLLTVLVCGFVSILPTPFSFTLGDHEGIDMAFQAESSETSGTGSSQSFSTTSSPVSVPPPDISDIINQITTSTYNNHLNHLAGTIGPRLWGTVDNDRAVEYIADEFESYGLDVDYHYFSSNQPNVIGTLHGGNIHNNATIVVGAHLDTYPASSPGADDDASGVSAVLEIARVLSPYLFNYTIMFVAFNAEEIGLVGSTALATKLADENVTVAVMYNFDMILWDTPAAPENWKVHIVHNGGDSAWFAQEAENLGQNLVGAPVQANDQPGWTSSDHSPFWNRGFPAVWFFEYNGWGNPWIHSSQDHLGRPEYSAELGALTTKTAAAAIADYATVISTQVGFPTIDFLSPHKNSFVTPDNQVELVLSVNDALGDVESMEIAINDGPWINATTGLNATHCTYPIDASSLYGTTVLKARAIDAEGWIAHTSTSVIFDAGIFCSIHTPQDDDVLDEGVEYTIWVNVTDPDNRNINYVQVRMNNSDWYHCYQSIPNKAYYYNWLARGNGQIPIQTRVADRNGRINTSQVIVTVNSYPPVISDVQFLPYQPMDTDFVSVSATVTQDLKGSGINQILVFYSVDGSYWVTRLMSNESGDRYSATLNPFPTGASIRFYILARDNFDNVAIDDNNQAYYVFTVVMNPTLLIASGAVVGIVVIGLGLFYFIRYRRRTSQVASPT